MADYEVKAELTLDAKKTKSEAKKAADEVKKLERQLERTRSRGQAALNAIGGAFTGFGRHLSGTSNNIGRIVIGLAAFGATYLGVRTVANALKDIALYSGRANSNVEMLTLSLGTVMAEIEGMTFADARAESEGLYRRIQDIAIESPGTAREVADVFTMAYGPMRRAGAAMDDILRLSQNTLSVAAALRIDLPQVSRDISMMASGVAGTDVKTFRLLRSMGMITETAKEWNEVALRDPATTANRLMDIFERLGGPAAEAFGRTWTGVTSAFSDIVENFMRIFGGPAFRAVRDQLLQVNEFLLRYRSNLENVAIYAGESIGRIFDATFGRMESIFTTTIGRLDEFALKIDTAIARIRELLPVMAQVAKGFLVFTVITKVMAPILTGVGALLTMISGLGGLAATLGIAPGVAAAGAAGAVGAGAAGTGVAGAGAISTALAAASAAFSAIIPIVAGVGAALGVIGAVVWSTFRRVGGLIWEALSPAFDDLSAAAGNVWAFLVEMWGFLEPIFVTLGSILAAILIPIIRGAASGLRGMTEILVWFGDGLSRVADVIIPYMHQFSRRIIQLSTQIANLISGPLRSFGRFLASFGINVRLPAGGEIVTPPRRTVESRPTAGLLSRLRDVFTAAREESERGLATRGPPPTRPTTNVDMRGSRIEVRQEFREADPDRIWLQFVDGITREAVVRTQTAYVNPLTR